jgi:hypothetical protein
MVSSKKVRFAEEPKDFVLCQFRFQSQVKLAGMS